jgi:hypothetical protein
MYVRFLSSWLVAGRLGRRGAGALAGGEPKNEMPFTRVAGVRTMQSAAPSSLTTARVAAEAKNEALFTRQVDATPAGAAAAGEPKNETPFTAVATVAADDGGLGFSWIDASLGLVLGIAMTIAAIGGTLLALHRTRRPA